MKNKILHPLWLILSFIVVLYVFFIVRMLFNPQYEALCASCSNNLKHIGIACQMHEEVNGNWPTQLEDLYSSHILDDDNYDVIKCPSTNERYIYVQPKLDAPSNTAIITCTNHNKGLKLKYGVTLYKSGGLLRE